jgi:hypothetical protein
MNRLKKYIKTHGRFISQGATRKAYVLGDRVFKIEVDRLYKDSLDDYISQNAEEVRFLQTAKEQLGDLNIFIDIKPITENIVVATKVDHIANRTGDFYEYCHDNDVTTSLKYYIEFCKEYYEDFKHDNIYAELEKAKMFGLGDIENNMGNIGYHRGYIKVVDYGYGC